MSVQCVSLSRNPLLSIVCFLLFPTLLHIIVIVYFYNSVLVSVLMKLNYFFNQKFIISQNLLYAIFCEIFLKGCVFPNGVWRTCTICQQATKIQETARFANINSQGRSLLLWFLLWFLSEQAKPRYMFSNYLSLLLYPHYLEENAASIIFELCFCRSSMNGLFKLDREQVRNSGHWLRF